MECKSCGHINAEHTNYCVNCGANLTLVNHIESKVIVDDKTSMSKASMILGIVSAVFGVVCCLGYFSIVFSIVCGVLAIVFSILSWTSGKQSYSISGLVCGIIGLIFGLITLIIQINIDAIIDYFEEFYGENPFETIIVLLKTIL